MDGATFTATAGCPVSRPFLSCPDLSCRRFISPSPVGRESDYLVTDINSGQPATCQTAAGIGQAAWSVPESVVLAFIKLP
jgi:hypothetical protein